MTLQSTESRIQYSPNGLTNDFAFPYMFLDDTHLEVILTSAAGVDTLQTLNSDYTVTGAEDPSGGTVTMTIAPVSGTTLTISRIVPITQLVDYIANDNFPAETHETTLDKLTMIAQMLLDMIGRCLIFPSSEDPTTDNDLMSIADRADKILGFDSDGDVTVYDFDSVVVPSPGAATVTIGSPSGTATTKSISINVDGVPNALIKIWLVDTNERTTKRTLIPPDGEGVADFEGFTDANGDLTFSFTHNDSQRSWYINIEIGTIVYLSTVLTLGT